MKKLIPIVAMITAAAGAAHADPFVLTPAQLDVVVASGSGNNNGNGNVGVGNGNGNRGNNNGNDNAGNGNGNGNSGNNNGNRNRGNNNGNGNAANEQGNGNIGDNAGNGSSVNDLPTPTLERFEWPNGVPLDLGAFMGYFGEELRFENGIVPMFTGYEDYFGWGLGGSESR